MKKFILILLMTLTLTSFFAINIFAINVDYTFNITDNKKWNLETGSIENDLKFAVTSKMIIKDDRIITSSETYHHVVFWNSKNQFIGYKNSQYSILENDYYLGNIEYGSAGFDAPANAHFFSFMIYKSGNAINYTELGNQSLSDIFDLYNSSNLEDKDNNTLDGYSLDELYNTQLSGKNLFDVNLGIYQNYRIDSNNGGLIYSAGNGHTDYIEILPNTAYIYSQDGVQKNYHYAYYDINQTFISGGINGATISPSNAKYIRYQVSIAHKNVTQLEKGSTATDFEPHESVLTRDYFKDYEQIANTNYTELDNGRLRYVVNQDTISSNSQPLYELNGLSLDDVFNTGNQITNGDFSNGTSGWTSNSTASFSVSNNVASFTANAQYGLISQIASPQTQANNVYFLLADIKADSNLVGFDPSSTPFRQFHSGNGQFETITIKYIAPTTANYGPRIIDTRTSGWTQIQVNYVYYIDMTLLGVDNLTEAQMTDYFNIYAYFLNGGTDPQTFTYDSPIYYDITYRLDEQFNELDITAQEFIDNQDGYNRIINNEQANDFILYYAAQYAQDNNTSLGLSIQDWEQYYLNYLTFDDANSPFIASLNYNSLNNIFVDNRTLIDFNSVILYTGTRQVIDDVFIYTATTTSSTSHYWEYRVINGLQDDKVYINYDFKVNDTLYNSPYASYHLLRTAFGTANVTPTDEAYSYVGTNNFLNFSKIITFLTSGDTRMYPQARTNAAVDWTGYITYYRNAGYINLTDLGIDNLTKAQMDAYYNDYIDNQTLEQNLYLQALTPTSFDLIDPNYDYTAPPPDDFLDVDSDTFLDNLLTNIGFNNDLGKVTLSILILFLTTLTLIKFNLGTSVILGVDILVYVGLTFLGWLPAWINILIALIIMVLFYLRFKGGGSNNEESD